MEEDANLPRVFVEDDLSTAVSQTFALEWQKELCLVDPKNKFYKDETKRKEALERLTKVFVKYLPFYEKRITVEDVLANIESVRRSFRRHRLARCEYFIREKKLPPNDEEWYVWIFKNIQDEKQLIYKHRIPHIKYKTEAAIMKMLAEHKRITKLIKNFLKAENEFVDKRMATYDSDYSENSDDEEYTPEQMRSWDNSYLFKSDSSDLSDSDSSNDTVPLKKYKMKSSEVLLITINYN